MKWIRLLIALMLMACIVLFNYVGCGGGGGSSGSSGGSGGPNSGDLIASFGIGGVITNNPSGDYDSSSDIAIQSTYMYLVGYDSLPGLDNEQWRIEKRSLIDGALDPSFGTNGVITSNPSAYTDYAKAIAIDSFAMYVVGEERESTGSGAQWRIEKRNLSNGALDGGFATGGVITSNPSVSFDSPLALAIDSTYMYVVGCDTVPGDEQFRIEKRNLSNGALVGGFGTGGVITSNPSANNNDIVTGIAIDSSYMYVVAYDSSPGAGVTQWRIEKRNLSDGALVGGFGTGGVITSNPSSGPSSIVTDSTYMYVVGSDSGQWRIEKRNLSDGALVGNFGTGGVITSNPGAAAAPSSITIDSQYMYIIGYDESPGIGNIQWRIEKRNLLDGALVSGFGTGGMITNDLSNWDDNLSAIAIDSTYMYVIGDDRSPGAGNAQWRIEKRVK